VRSTAITSALRDFPINLYALDEVGHLFAVNGSRNAGTHKMEILPMFTEVYSKAHGQWDGTGYGDTKMLPKTKIINPHIVFFGVTARDVMMRTLRSGNRGDGSLARFLMIRPTIDYPRSREVTVQPIPDSLTIPLRIMAGLPEVEGNISAIGIGPTPRIRLSSPTYARSNNRPMPT
jgi:hypothetical protein